MENVQVDAYHGAVKHPSELDERWVGSLPWCDLSCSSNQIPLSASIDWGVQLSPAQFLLSQSNLFGLANPSCPILNDNVARTGEGWEELGFIISSLMQCYLLVPFH